jgi:dihydropteroate synthase
VSRISKELGVPVSVDTYHAATADAAVRAGAAMINDIWGLKADPDMAPVAASHGVPVCLMHNRAEPNYVNLMDDIRKDLGESIELALKQRIRQDNIIIVQGIVSASQGAKHECSRV